MMPTTVGTNLVAAKLLRLSNASGLEESAENVVTQSQAPSSSIHKQVSVTTEVFPYMLPACYF
jgi:hypothetical protein